MEDDVDAETATVLSIADILTNTSYNTNDILINSKEKKHLHTSFFIYFEPFRTSFKNICTFLLSSGFSKEENVSSEYLMDDLGRRSPFFKNYLNDFCNFCLFSSGSNIYLRIQWRLNYAIGRRCHRLRLKN